MEKISLKISNPELASEWHPTKNRELEPSDIVAGSYKKAWWVCPIDNEHVWEATIASRNRGAGCPFCSGRRATKTNNLAVTHPEIANQWHSTKNKELTPYDVKSGSDRKVWWKCSIGEDHEWESTIANRKAGTGCPICTGKKVVESTSLGHLNPTLSNEWHPTKNGSLTPYDVTPYSGKKVWWKCPKGDDHEWQSSIANRSKSQGCPYCSSRKVSKTNSLAFKGPKASALWHPSKNGNLTPSDVTAYSGKKVWWKCPEGDDHVWKAVVSNIFKGHGCPFCSGRRASKTNNLAVLNPKLAKQWHPTKNGNLRPNDVLPSTSKKVWWICPENPSHVWKAQLNNRFNGTGCPICSNTIIIRENSLGEISPELAKQWHPTKNGDLTPFDVAPSGSQKVWWKCPKGDDHEWKTTINKRATGNGCPKCNPAWSVPELRIYTELKSIFHDIQHRAIKHQEEVDIYIPAIKVGIEYDGVYWHKNKIARDKKKNASLSEILLIRIREHDLPMISPIDIPTKSRKLSKRVINILLQTILDHRDLSEQIKSVIRTYLSKEGWSAQDMFDRMYAERKTVQFENSVENLFPHLAKQWHPTKNGELTPSQFTPGSGRKIWWLGPCGHEWIDSLNHRSRGRDCPKCRNKKASRTWKENNHKDQLKLFD